MAYNQGFYNLALALGILGGLILRMRGGDLAALGYEHKWWQYGFVDELSLASQFTLLRAGSDANTEHYRYETFLHILETCAALDEITLTRFVELATLDSDQTMAESALIRLVHWSGLTAAQRDWLRRQPALASPVVQRAFTRIARRAGQRRSRATSPGTSSRLS